MSEELKVPTSAELLSFVGKRKEKVVDYAIPEWGVKVKLIPVSFGKYHELSHDISYQFEKNPSHAALQANLLWIGSCLVEPKMTFDEVQQLAEAELGVMTRLAYKCRSISGDLPDEFNDEVEELKNDLGAEVATGESTPPASNDSESTPDKQG